MFFKICLSCEACKLVLRIRGMTGAPLMRRFLCTAGSATPKPRADTRERWNPRALHRAMSRRDHRCARRSRTATRGAGERYISIIQGGWCPWPESNQHSLRNSILSRARLPIPPQGPSHDPRLGKVSPESRRTITKAIDGSIDRPAPTHRRVAREWPRAGERGTKCGTTDFALPRLIEGASRPMLEVSIFRPD